MRACCRLVMMAARLRLGVEEQEQLSCYSDSKGSQVRQSNEVTKEFLHTFRAGVDQQMIRKHIPEEQKARIRVKRVG